MEKLTWRVICKVLIAKPFFPLKEATMNFRKALLGLLAVTGLSVVTPASAAIIGGDYQSFGLFGTTVSSSYSWFHPFVAGPNDVVTGATIDIVAGDDLLDICILRCSTGESANVRLDGVLGGPLNISGLIPNVTSFNALAYLGGGGITVSLTNVVGDFQLYSSTLTVEGRRVVTSVPELATLGVMGFGLMGIGFMRRRRSS